MCFDICISLYISHIMPESYDDSNTCVCISSFAFSISLVIFCLKYD